MPNYLNYYGDRRNLKLESTCYFCSHKMKLRTQHCPKTQNSIAFNLCYYLQPLEKQKYLPVLLITPTCKQKGRLVIITCLSLSSGGKEKPPFGLGKTGNNHSSFLFLLLVVVCECVYFTCART